ncbi:hypothetical protein BCR36DRAFT_587914 [Piromyces finnis]|uniref:Uncharacterized protein n=1 Tax=Piromyces finnis TaxID=1754191 RepID=A0A1Y1UUG6_9FUNG|nr:hypothetical protein BCR36DRAFT_587909 [Piromyces finnis]ORX41596.1 hypothetical protein BCR36DRAFT_587914 [Piromyces finnis]|eukprot:ORX41572.1 hypothetical protein BCR36DRAFT_587909 [Piromyces finnis]
MLTHYNPNYSAYTPKKIASKKHKDKTIEYNPQNDNQLSKALLNTENSEIVMKIKNMEDLLNSKLIKEFYDSISQLTHTEILDILKYSLKNDLKNFKQLLSPYWMEYKELFYILYFSSIKNSSYASNKKRSINDFSNMIMYSDRNFENWTLLKNKELKNLSIVFQRHYNEKTSIRINNRLKYVYVLCNDFTLRYRDLRSDLNLYSKKEDDSNNRFT